MKKAAIILLTLIMLFSCSSCSKKMDRIHNYESFTTEMSKKIDLSSYKLTCPDVDSYDFEHKEDIFVKDKKSNFQVTLNGKKVTMPAKVSEILDTGYKITEIDYNPVSNPDMNKKYSFTSVTFANDKGRKISCYLYGSIDKTSAPLKDCLITQISTDINNKTSSTSLSEELQNFVDGKYPDTKYFGSIGIDSSLNDILDTLGAPRKIKYWDSKTYDFLALSYYFKDSEGRNGSIQINMHTISPYEDVEYTEFSNSLSYRIDMNT